MKSGYVDTLVAQLNNYRAVHGQWPDEYLDMQDCPEYSNGTLPYSADDGPSSGQAIKYTYDDDANHLTIKIKTPDVDHPKIAW